MAWKIEKVILQPDTYTAVTVPQGYNMVRFFFDVHLSTVNDLAQPYITIYPSSAYGQRPQDFPVEEGQVFYMRPTGSYATSHEILFFRAPKPAGFTGTLDITSK